VAQGARRRLDRHAEPARGSQRRQRVQDVEVPRQRDAHRHRPVRRQGGERRAAQPRRDVDGPEPRAVVGPERPGVRELLGEAAPVGVVRVDHPHARRGGEQPALGLEVVLHRRVEVQVVLGEVREDGDRPVDRGGAPEFERVGGHLHDARVVPRGEHLGEERLQVDGLGSRAHDRPLRTAHHGGDRADEPVDRPAASSTSRTRKAVVVLPFVPVIPTRRSRAVGSPWKRAAAVAMAARTSSTTTSGTPRPRGRWTTRAAAPRSTASGAKS
jgi:hypothetical protein